MRERVKEIERERDRVKESESERECVRERESERERWLVQISVDRLARPKIIKNISLSLSFLLSSSPLQLCFVSFVYLYIPSHSLHFSLFLALISD